MLWVQLRIVRRKFRRHFRAASGQFTLEVFRFAGNRYTVASRGASTYAPE